MSENTEKLILDDLINELRSTTLTCRGGAYVDMNCHRWPKIFSSIKPEEWGVMNNKERQEHPISRIVWDAIHKSTTRFERSQAWWVIGLDRTTEAHLEWWDNDKHHRPIPTTNEEE